MSDDLEFTRELDEQQQRKAQADDAGGDIVDIITTGREEQRDGIDEADYDVQSTEGMAENILTDMSIDQSAQTEGAVETDRGGMGEKAESDDLPIEQNELDKLITEVTELGADESVLGREGMLEAFRQAEESEKKGGSYVEGFVTAAEQMLGIEKERVDNGTESTPAFSAHEPTREEAARERFNEHKEKYDSRLEYTAPWPRDSVDAYHRMAMTYNAYVAGEKIDGAAVSKVDVFLSGLRFYQSNIFETAIIRSLRFAGDVIKDKFGEKVEVEQNAVDTGAGKETKLRDDAGAFDHGDASVVSKEVVEAARQNIKEYGFEYGIDTTRGMDFNSTDNVKIYRATDIVGRLDAGPGKTLHIPGIRMVEIEGNLGLVTPDGKVVHESIRFGSGDGFRQEDIARIEYRCNALDTPNMRSQIEQMAESRGVNVETIKAEYAEKAMDAYASRIEKTMLTEADRLEKQTIPEAKEELQSLREDLSRLDKIDLSLSREGVEPPQGISKSEIAELRTELKSGIETLESRISAMESRVELLRDTHAQVDNSGVKDRFDRAASCEEQAVGRGGRIEYISNDTDKRLLDVIDSGTELVKSDVELYNEANPENMLTYDPDTGEMYNRFGVSESGNFDPDYATVPASELPAETPEAISEYISQHIDEDFDKYKEFTTSEQPAERTETGEAAKETVTTDTTAADSSVAEETEAKVVAAHDADISDSHDGKMEKSGGEKTAGQEEATAADEFKDQIKDLFDSFLGDTEGVVSLEQDVISPIIDMAAEAGKTDFKEAIEVLTDIANGVENLQPEELSKFTDLVRAVADISLVPADAIDTFQGGIENVDFANEIIAELGTPDVVGGEEVIPEVQVTIGEQDLSVTSDGAFDAATGEPTGGFGDDSAAEQYLDETDQSLFDVAADTPDITAGDVDTESRHSDVDSLHDELQEIGLPDVSVGEGSGAETTAGAEAGVEISGVEAAESAVAAIEAGSAGAAALL